MLYISKSWQHVIILDGEQLRLGGGDFPGFLPPYESHVLL